MFLSLRQTEYKELKKRQEVILVTRECLKIHLKWSFCTNHRKDAFAFLPT